MRAMSVLETAAGDLRLAARMLRRSPGVTLVAVLSLTLAIGANTAIFSVLDAVLLRPLPVSDPGSLAQVQLRRGTRTQDYLSYPQFTALQSTGDVFRGVIAAGHRQMSVEIGGSTERLETQFVSGGYYDALGVRPAVGRLLGPHDDQPGAPQTAVLSHSAWQRRFAADPAIVSRTVRVEGVPFTIVGVAPPRFFGVVVGQHAEVTIPIAAEPILAGERSALPQVTAPWLIVLGRLAPDTSADRARARLQTVWPEIREELAARATSPRGQRDMRALAIDVVDGRRGFSAVRKQFSRPLIVLMGSVMGLLLIACANVANLLLMRATIRRREVGIRVAVGATRGRIVRQLLTESLLLAAIATAFGLMVSRAGTRLLARLVAQSTQAVSLDVAPDWRMFAFCVAIGALTSVLFGLAPAIAAVRVGQRAAFDIGSRSVTAGSRAGKPIVVAQVALSLVLLVGAGLFVRTMHTLLTLDLGFRTEGVMLASFDLSKAGAKGEALLGQYRDLLERVEAIPGVHTASLSMMPPLTGGGGMSLSVTGADGYTAQPKEDATIFVQVVAPGYFEALATPLVDGRGFHFQDSLSAEKVAIVDEATVQHYFPGRNPLGRRLSVENAPYTIVGVVKNAKYETLREKGHRTIYMPLFQSADTPPMATLIVRAESEQQLTAVVPVATRMIRSSVADVPVVVETLWQTVDRTLSQERLLMTISSVFGLLALVLVAIGIYSILAYSVARRRAEIGVRIALGARPIEILRMVFREAFATVAAGLVMGVVLALWLAQFVSSLLFGLAARDTSTVVAAVWVVLATAAVASLIPARSAARVDPTTTLR